MFSHPFVFRCELNHVNVPNQNDKNSVKSILDSHILHLSHRITSEQELRDLGTKGFKLEKSIIDNALFDHRTSIQGAAHEVLHRWVNMQTRGREEAYMNLLTALAKCKMNQLAAYLRELAEGEAEERTEESKKQHCSIY